MLFILSTPGYRTMIPDDVVTSSSRIRLLLVLSHFKIDNLMVVIDLILGVGTALRP